MLRKLLVTLMCLEADVQEGARPPAEHGGHGVGRNISLVEESGGLDGWGWCQACMMGELQHNETRESLILK